MVGYGFEGALKFGFYEAFKIIFAGVTQYQFVNYLMASVIAGAIASVVLVSFIPIAPQDHTFSSYHDVLANFGQSIFHAMSVFYL